MLSPLAFPATPPQKSQQYDAVAERLRALLEGETDGIAAMATMAAELHHAFEAFHWTGFYRVIEPQTLVIGPYQGGHGCLRIRFEHGVCGAAARTKQTQRVEDVSRFDGHIACSSTTRSEIVVPILDSRGETLAVFDIDSDFAAAFDTIDQAALEALCDLVQPILSAELSQPTTETADLAGSSFAEQAED